MVRMLCWMQKAFPVRLPEPLRSGKGLVGFGIVSEEEVAEEMFAASAPVIGRLFFFRKVSGKASI